MKCIDAIEGTVKHILQQLHAVCVEENLDDTEYVRNIKAVLEGADLFTRANPEIVEDPDLLTQVLYTYSRNLWLTHQQLPSPETAGKATDSISENEEYQTYYFDYLYHRGIYPL
ncbi:MAG: hypothetical protein M0036_18065 [Desulfobacteraceae bacterium]|nr:hypothetical protein [Desulfobacteraceae bacterium]